MAQGGVQNVGWQGTLRTWCPRDPTTVQLKAGQKLKHGRCFWGFSGLSNPKMKSPEPPGQTVKRYGMAESGAERWLAGNSKDLVPERPQHSSVESWPKA
jgi:hypothetical protein